MSQGLSQLLSVLETYNIAITKDDARQAFDDGHAQGLTTWVQQHLTPDTLLSAEEEAL